MRPGPRLSAGSRLWLAALGSCLLRCSGFTAVPADGGARDGATGDGGAREARADALPAVTCTSTTLRGLMPLGQSTLEADEAGIVPLASGKGVSLVWESEAKSDPRLYWAWVDFLGKPRGAKELARGRDPLLLPVAGGAVLFYSEGTSLKRVQLDDQGVFKGQPATVHTPLTSSFDGARVGAVHALVLNGVEEGRDEVHLLRVGSDGKILSGPTKVPQSGINSTLARVAWDGRRLLLSWTDMREGTPAVYAALFDERGQRQGNDLRVSAAGTKGAFPSVAPQAGGGFVLCYEQKVTETNHEVFCARTDGEGKVTNQVQLTRTAGDSFHPRAVAHGALTWVLWDERSAASEPRLYWQFLDAQGAPLLAQPRDPEVRGWRPHAVSTPDGLYFLHYNFGSGTSVLAEVGTVNCF